MSIYLFIWPDFFPSVADSPGVCTHGAGRLLHLGKDFAVSKLRISSHSAWITGFQWVFYNVRLKCFSPLDCLLLERCVSGRLGRFFHIFCCGCYYSALQQQTPCLFLKRHLKCYFWHLYFLQRVTVIAVTGLASALSQLTAPPLFAAERGGALERSTWIARSSAKVTDSPAINSISSTAAGPKFSYMQILQKAQELEGFN